MELRHPKRRWDEGVITEVKRWTKVVVVIIGSIYGIYCLGIGAYFDMEDKWRNRTILKK